MRPNLFKLGERVHHPSYGRGTVTYYYRDSSIGWCYTIHFDGTINTAGVADVYVESALTAVSAVDQLGDLVSKEAP